METPVRKVVILQQGSGKRFIKMHPDQLRSVVSLPQSQSSHQPNFSQLLQLAQPSQSSPSSSHQPQSSHQPNFSQVLQLSQPSQSSSSSSHQPQPSPLPEMSLDSGHQVFAMSPAGPDSTQITFNTPTHSKLPAAVKSEKADWKAHEVSILIELAGPLFALNNKITNASYAELTETLNQRCNSSYTQTQCRDKFLAVNQSRRQKVLHNHASGSDIKNLTPHEQHLHDIIHQSKTPIEVPAGEEAHCASSLAAPQAPSSASAQVPVAMPHRLKQKKKHGTGTREAASKNGMRVEWVEHLRLARQHRELLIAHETRKLKAKEDAVEALNKKNVLENAKLLFAKEKLEFMKNQAESNREFATKMIAVEKEKVETLKSIKAMLQNHQLLNSV